MRPEFSLKMFRAFVVHPNSIVFVLLIDDQFKTKAQKIAQADPSSPSTTLNPDLKWPALSLDKL